MAIKLCKDCKHYAGADICGKKPSPVDGKPRDMWCSIERDLGFFTSLIAGKCGIHGRWWEPKTLDDIRDGFTKGMDK